MSHEIRTPLNAIVGFSSMLEEAEDQEEKHQYITIIEDNNKLLLQLISDILDLSKIEAETFDIIPERVNAKQLCNDLFQAMQMKTSPQVELRLKDNLPELTFTSDKNRLYQVLLNFVTNALKFTSEGNITIDYQIDGNEVKFSVQDTGMGIEPEKQEAIFTRFVKLNSFIPGTGLGLSICKTIVERLGGEISVSSVVGQGTTFTFTLPYESEQSTGTGSMKIDMASTETSVETSVKEDSEKTSGNTDDNSSDSISANASPSQRTILIAEDEDSNFDLLKAILGRKYRLIRARDGMEAVTSYDEAKPDLILMDIKMPNLDGLEATKIIRELSPTVPIIAQSAYAYQQDQIAATDAGCSDFIAKPISQAKLKDMINKWLP